MRFSIYTLAPAFVAALASAAWDHPWQQPSGANVGNPISEPGSTSIVPVGINFTITWAPTTTTDFVDIVLLRGPSTNILPLYALATHIPNSGTYVWNPSTSLEDDVTHYGIQIIVDGSGTYQYSTQFGISNPQRSLSSSSSPSASTQGDVGLPSQVSSTTVVNSDASGIMVVNPSGTGSVTSGAPGITASISSSIPSSSASTTTSQAAYGTACSVSQISDGQIQAGSNCTLFTASVPLSTLTSASIAPITTHLPIPISTGALPVPYNATSPTYNVPNPSSVVFSTFQPLSSSVLQPTRTMTVPATLQTSTAAATAGSSGSSTNIKAASPTNAAGRPDLSVGGLLAAVAGFAVFLL